MDPHRRRIPASGTLHEPRLTDLCILRVLTSQPEMKHSVARSTQALRSPQAWGCVSRTFRAFCASVACGTRVVNRGRNGIVLWHASC